MESGPVEIEAYQSGLTCLLLRTIFCLITQLGELPDVQGVWEILRGHLFDDLSKGLILLSPSYGSCVFWACLPKNVNQRNIWRHFLLHTGAELPHLLFFFILGGLIDSIFQSEKPWTGNILGLWFFSTPARGLKFKIYTSEIHNQPQHALSDIYSGSSILYINIRK